jgi:hypothetical protein
MPRQRDPNTISVQDLQQEEAGRKINAYDRMYGDQGDDSQLRLAENSLVEARSRPQAQLVRPKVSTGKKILGSFLESTAGGHRIGERMLGEKSAREDFDFANVARAREERNLEANVNTLRSQRTRDVVEPWQLRNQEALLGKTDAEIGLASERGRTEQSRQGMLGAQEERMRRPTVKAARPGSLLFSEKGQVQAGSAEAYGKAGSATRTSPFGTYSPGQGIYNRDTGTIQTPTDPRAAAAARPASGAGAPSTKVLQVEGNKSKRLIDHQKMEKTKRDQIIKKWQGIDTTSPTRADGTANPYAGALQKEIADHDTWNNQQKNLIQRSYENELNRLGQDVEHFQYGDEGGADANAMQPAEGEDQAPDTDAMKLELQEGEILFHDPETNRYFAAPADRMDELLGEGYEEVP